MSDPEEKIRLKPKMIGSFVVTALGVVGTGVTILSGKTWAIITALVILGVGVILLIWCFAMWIMREYKRYRVMMKNIQLIKDTMDHALLHNEELEFNKMVSDIAEKTECFGITCKDTRNAVKNSHQSILSKLDNKGSLQYYTAYVTEELLNLLDNNHDIDKIRIICFGRNGYGEVVPHIHAKRLPIKLEIIVCNPEKNDFICKKDDNQRIRSQIREMMGDNKADIYVSDIPPAIRASTVYVKDRPIWSATQPYQFERSKDGKLELFRPPISLIVTCDESSSKKDFDGVVKCFEDEFERLQKKSLKPALTENDEIIFISK